MNLSNFKLVETRGKSPLDWEYIAEVDVTTRGIIFWKSKVERKKIRKEFACAWHFIDTGEFLPNEIENLARAWEAQTGQPT